MFTGIIETMGRITGIRQQGTNLVFSIQSSISGELKTDQSVSHNGACLTVTGTGAGGHEVAAVAETLEKTNLGSLKEGDWVNLERSMLLNGRVDGHLVQGHVDATGECTGRTDRDGSVELRFRFPKTFTGLVIEKGSICLNGISLTVFNLTDQEFTVALIPYTLEHTNTQFLKPGDKVNLEFDLIGKYIRRQVVVNSQ